MADVVCLLSIPGLEAEYLPRMPFLKSMAANGASVPIEPSFPALTCPVQASMTTGVPPSEHGVIANGFYWRDKHEVEMWTAWNDCIERPQIWDLLHQHDASLTSAVWFPLHIKGCGADSICTFAPIHNPDGSESLWCYTRPEPMYGELRDTFGHFPLKHFWGPLAGIESTEWIVSSAIWSAIQDRQRFWYIYLPHLDYATQKHGPRSAEALTAAAQLDTELRRLTQGFDEAYGDDSILWLAASEYVVSGVDHVCYPNRILRELGMVDLTEEEGREYLQVKSSTAWALADHQIAHVFVVQENQQAIGTIVDRFRKEPGIAQVLTREDYAAHGIDHPRSGEVVLISQANSWQAYYWWLNDAKAPTFASTVDIHRKPGFDPAEMFFDPTTKGISLNANLVRGSHGAPVPGQATQGILVTSSPDLLAASTCRDVDITELVLQQFGAQ